MAEVIDVVDETGEVIEQRPRADVHDKGLLHLAVHVILQDASGRILLQQRAPGKRTYPGTWTSSASGHVPTGQAPAQAAVREAEEELGISDVALEPVTTLRVQDPSVNEDEIVHLFHGRATGTPEPDPTEVSAVQACTVAEVQAWIDDEPDRFAASFLPVWEAWQDAKKGAR